VGKKLLRRYMIIDFIYSYLNKINILNLAYMWLGFVILSNVIFLKPSAVLGTVL
jgi:hypothetical protein